jgi:hypothetical protein
MDTIQDSSHLDKLLRGLYELCYFLKKAIKNKDLDEEKIFKAYRQVIKEANDYGGFYFLYKFFAIVTRYASKKNDPFFNSRLTTNLMKSLYMTDFEFCYCTNFERSNDKSPEFYKHLLESIRIFLGKHKKLMKKREYENFCETLDSDGEEDDHPFFKQMYQSNGDTWLKEEMAKCKVVINDRAFYI